jgi:SAM-dependent methyltransferase
VAGALWSGATYERVAETFAPIHARVVEALAPRPGERFLDLACGTGELALLAARAGSQVWGLDISADQLEKARAAAASAGLAIHFDEGDAQTLPYEDAGFDAVASTFGLIFAPNHTRAAGELARVCRAGGRSALTAWPRDDWFELGSSLGRKDPPGDDSRGWARVDYVRSLLGEDFELRFESGIWAIEAESPAALWELISASVPPVRSWLEGLEPARRAEVDAAYLDFLADGRLSREYVLVLGERR